VGSGLIFETITGKLLIEPFCSVLLVMRCGAVISHLRRRRSSLAEERSSLMTSEFTLTNAYNTL
jgi:hypothetical protein